MNKQFNRNNAPTTRVLLINLTQAISYMVRAASNMWQIADTQGNSSIKYFQYRACKEQNAKYAVFIFFLHFFGEILPLCLIFRLQVYMYVFKVKRKQKALIEANLRARQSSQDYEAVLAEGRRASKSERFDPSRTSKQNLVDSDITNGQAQVSTLQSQSWMQRSD